MFFEPPKVKSLSRYAEYGAYLGNKHFLMMLGVAMAAHLGVIGIYSMMPSEKVIKIPVRVLNIKLTGGSIGNTAVPAPSAMPAMTAPAQDPGAAAASTAAEEAMKSVRASEAEKVMDKALKPQHKAATPAVPSQRHAVPPGMGKVARPAQKAHPVTKEMSLYTPKQFIRETAAASSAAAAKAGRAAAGNGNGSTVEGTPGGTEVITRYTQTITQWIGNHQIYARAAYGEAAQGQNRVAGQAVVRLRIDRDGHILFNSIDRTSGNELVDEAIIAMVRASDPVPTVPTNYPSDSQLEFLIAVQVDLSRQK